MTAGTTTPDPDKNAPAPNEWHYAPETPIGNNPLFEFPWRRDRIFAYYRDYWLTISEVTIFLGLAIGSWGLLATFLGDMSVLSWGWVAIIYALNFGLVILFAGGFHLFFYTLRRQGDDQKYVPVRPPGRWAFHLRQSGP